MPVRFALLALIAAVAWGCASAKDAYVDGMELETAGDYAQAANAYIVSLERDRSLPNVAGRLRVAGRQAVRQLIDRAGALAPEAAALTYRDADALVRRAAAVGVDVERPASFEDTRDALYAQAVEVLTEEADASSRAGAFPDALDRIGRAQAFGPTDAEAVRLNAIAIDTYGAWAESDLASGRYRDALARADAALGLGIATPHLDALRADILDAGRVVVAVFPAEGDDDISPTFLRDLTDVLIDERLADAGPFVGLVPQADVRAWTRRRRSGPDLSDSPRRLAEAADDVGADLGAVVVVTDVSERETARDADPVTVRVRDSSERATLTMRTLDLTLTARADAVVAADGQTVCDASAEARGTARYTRATSDTDWRRLDLTRAQRAAFADDADDRARDQAFDDLREHLATALATRFQRCFDDQVR